MSRTDPSAFPPVPARELPMLPLVYVGNLAFALGLGISVLPGLNTYLEIAPELLRATCAWGLAWGVAGWIYLMRGKGNAADARLRTRPHPPSESPGSQAP